MIQTKRLQIVPFEMKFLKDYCEGFNTEIAKYQWPDPFETPEKGYAYEALSEVLAYACRNYHKEAFFYEADIRNEGSTKLLHKLGEHFDILKRDLDELTTDSGKELKLQGYVLKVKGL